MKTFHTKNWLSGLLLVFEMCLMSLSSTAQSVGEIPANDSLPIALNEAGTKDQMIVTGVFEVRTKMNASIAVGTLNSNRLDKIVPNSAIDLLKHLPGLYVNTARGEVGNSIYTRGLNYSGGFTYLSVQEDGLPVMGISGLINPDAFLRYDATIERIEMARGGSASILAPNAPGGIVNYLSKTGGQTFSGILATRFGLEGNGKNPYYRAEFNLGGPLNKAKNLTFNIGGFYRNADGAKYPGYTLSYGGQLKANLVKKYKTGLLKLYAKLLDDHTAPFEFTPTLNFEKPRPAGSFDNTSSTLVQSQQFTIPGSITSSETLDYDTRKVGAYNEIAGGVHWEQKWSTDWTFVNKLRVSKKAHVAQTTELVFPIRVDQLAFYDLNLHPDRYGVYEFYNIANGNSYGSVQVFPPRGRGQPIGIFPINMSLPGGDIMPNALFHNPNPYLNLTFTDIIEQATLSKKFKDMNLSIGVYYASTQTTRLTALPAAHSFATIQDKPQAVGIRFTDQQGKNYDLTNPNGTAYLGASGFYNNNARSNQMAFFLGHTWEIVHNLNLDWGLRYENFAVNSSFTTPKRLPLGSPTGADGNSATLYDNLLWTNNPEQNFKKDLQSLSYSFGMNYQVNENFAFYGRYAQGHKSPDLNFFMNIGNQQLTSNISVEAQNTQMAEWGFKLEQDQYSLNVTQFYTLLSHVPNFQVFQNLDLSYYTPAPLFHKFQSLGLELEGKILLNAHFSIRAVATFQDSEVLAFSAYQAKANGPLDDENVTYNGNKNDNVGTIVMITPMYQSKKFHAAFYYQFMGRRWANLGNAFQLPAFSSIDLNLGYNCSTKLQLSASVNNLLNTYGIMSWAAPGPLPTPLNTQGFTKEMLEADPNAVYSSMSILPRAFFLTATYKF